MRIQLPSQSNSIRVHELLDLKSDLGNKFITQGKLSCARTECELKSAELTSDTKGTWFVGKEFDYIPEVYLTFKEIGYKTFVLNGERLARRELPKDLKIEKIFVCFQTTTELDTTLLLESSKELGDPVQCYFQETKTGQISRKPSGYTCSTCNYQSDFNSKLREDILPRLKGLSLKEALVKPYQEISPLLTKPNELIAESGISICEKLNLLSPGQQVIARLLGVLELNLTGLELEIDTELFAGRDRTFLDKIISKLSSNNKIITNSAIPEGFGQPISEFRPKAGLFQVITGKVGSGKSNLLKAINPAKYCSQDYPKKAAGLKGTLFFHSTLYEELLEEVTAISLKENTSKASLFEKGHFDEWLALTPHELVQHFPQTASVCSLMIELGLNKKLGISIESFTRSELRKIQIVKYIKQSTKPVILDHTLSKLTESEVELVISRMKKFQNTGTNFIAVTHNSQLLKLADEVFSTNFP